MIDLHLVYVLAGLMFGSFALRSVIDRRDRKRWGTAVLWGLLSISFLCGDFLGDFGNGLLAVALILVAGLGFTGPGPVPQESAEDRQREAARRGNRLFLPALLIPATALAGTIAFKRMPLLVAPGYATLIALALGALLSLLLCLWWFSARPAVAQREGLRLMDGIGWAVLLPQMLASLGVVFGLTGMGDVLGQLIRSADAGGSLFVDVAVYAAGMAFLTILIGNALAAFPVMFAAIGAPTLVVVHHGDPAAVAAVGMLAGFCGTLLTPMAANFNLVPAALLDLRDRYGVIRAQWPTAVAMLAANIAILYFMGFPR